MANIIKKISAFDSLPANGVTPDIVFPVVKDSSNYKLSFENFYAAMDWYMANSESSLNDKFVNKTELENYPTKEDFSELQESISSIPTHENIKKLEEKIDNCATIEYVDSTFITEDDLEEIHASYASKEDTFTKEEVQNKIDEMISAYDERIKGELPEIIKTNETIVDLDKRVQVNELDIEKLKESTGDTETLLKTDGDGSYVLGNDGKYHNLTCLSLLDSGSIQLTNDMVDENNVLTVSFSMPKLPYKHTIHVHITLGNSIFKDTNAGILAIKYDGEINDLVKRFTSGKSVVELAFENEVVQFQDGKGGLSNFIKTSTYFNEDKISDTIKIRSTVLELLHDTYDTVITLVLTGKLPENVTHDLTWCVFGHGILDSEGE